MSLQEVSEVLPAGIEMAGEFLDRLAADRGAIGDTFHEGHDHGWVAAGMVGTVGYRKRRKESIDG
jgi:hypothetical protein